MRKLQNAFTLMAFAIVLTGCASIGTEPAQTFNQKWAYAVGINQAIYDTVTSTVTQGTLSSADGAKIIEQNDQAKTVLETAKMAYNAGDSAGANAKLSIALTSLTALQEYLRAHGAKP